MNEPSVLDYIKAKLTPWRGPAPEIPRLPKREGEEESPLPPESAVPDSASNPTMPNTQSMPMPPSSPPKTEGYTDGEERLEFTAAGAILVPSAGGGAMVAQTAHRAVRLPVPWMGLLALFLALVAQVTFEPSPDRSAMAGILLYLVGVGALVWANTTGEWGLAPLRDKEKGVEARRAGALSFVTHPYALFLSMIFALGAFVWMGGNLLTPWNVTLWALAVFCGVYAFWQEDLHGSQLTARMERALRHPNWQLRITPWTILAVMAILLVVFFRVFRLSQVPSQMVSDHAEKLLDVYDVLTGQTHIFFPRNTGRELFQFYLTAAVIKLFGTGISFLSLKIGTTIAGLVTLVYVYLLGKEVGNRGVGLAAAFMAGIAYWPNVITRMALRFTLYPLFVAPTLYYLMRGLRRRNRNDFIFAGLFLGLGLHGYTPFRIVPLVVLIGVGLYLLHRASQGARQQTLFNLGVLVVVSILVFLPLGRYALDNPGQFNFRALSRLGSIEQPLPGSAVQIFLQNTWRAVTMFAWDDGETWPTSITHRPALDVVSGALFYLGVALLAIRYLRRRRWQDLFLILSVPLLMLPSILSLAFPNENPNLSRTAGAIVPVFVIVGLALEGLWSGGERRRELIQKGLGVKGNLVGMGVVGILLVFSTWQNYDLVFRQYAQSFDASAWNTTELGQVIRNFAGSIGSLDQAWVVAFPYWVDTRLVGINAGNPTRDYAIWPEHFADTLSVPGPKLFLIKLEDTSSLKSLEHMYPTAWVEQYHSQDPTKDFWILTVPGSR